MSNLCRARGTEVAVRVAGCVNSRLILQLLERSSYKVIMESLDVRQVAAAREGGPQLVGWAAFSFQQFGPWGDVGRQLPAAAECDAVMRLPLLSEAANAWSLPQLVGGTG